MGFVFDRQHGAHAVYFHDGDGRRVVIPMHAGKTIKLKTLAAILDDMEVSLEEFRGLL